MHKNIYNEKHRLCDIANSTLIFFSFSTQIYEGKRSRFRFMPMVGSTTIKSVCFLI